MEEHPRQAVTQRRATKKPHLNPLQRRGLLGIDNKSVGVAACRKAGNIYRKEKTIQNRSPIGTT